MHSKYLFVVLAAMTAFSGTAYADGADEFSQLCASCHGRKGEGMAYVAPPLKGSEFLRTASADDIKATIRAGRAGEAKKHPDFPAAMPPFTAEQINDHELDELVTFLKTRLQE